MFQSIFRAPVVHCYRYVCAYHPTNLHLMLSVFVHTWCAIRCCPMLLQAQCDSFQFCGFCQYGSVPTEVKSLTRLPYFCFCLCAQPQWQSKNIEMTSVIGEVDCQLTDWFADVNDQLRQLSWTTDWITDRFRWSIEAVEFSERCHWTLEFIPFVALTERIERMSRQNLLISLNSWDDRTYRLGRLKDWANRTYGLVPFTDWAIRLTQISVTNWASRSC